MISYATALIQARERGHTPIAVLDVDLTLIDNAPRTRAILSDWAHGQRGRWEGAAEAAIQAATMPIIFSAHANIRSLGVADDALMTDALAFWWSRFFTDRYAAFDVPLPGAVSATRRLIDDGVTVVYLTARPTTMAAGTTQRLAELGFPVAQARTSLVMKHEPKQHDGDYKREALGWIKTLGAAVLCADNEPGHVNAMREAFPDASAVLVDTRHSPGAPPLAPGIRRVPSLLDALIFNGASDALDP